MDASGQPAPPAPAAVPYRHGTLAYSPRELLGLFFWLLTGDVLFVLVDQIEPKVLPILLRQHQATDAQIALLVGSVVALINVIVNPIVSYRSDRKRSRRGRRIPYLLWATPFVGAFLAITPFAPEIGAALARSPLVEGWLQALPWTPTLVAFAVLVALFQVFEKVIAAVYFYLFRDVVPETHVGRFFTLFRVCGALATFALNYWIVGLAEAHPREVFGAIGVLYIAGFLGLCFFVREGEYPPTNHTTIDRTEPAGPIRIFAVESFSAPIYCWTYFTRTMINGSAAILPFTLFFARDELALTYDHAGKLMAWASGAWLVVAWPAGRLLERWGSVRLLQVALWLLAASYALSFFGIVGAKTFLVFCTVTGMAHWLVVLGQIVLIQQVFHASRMGQLCSANVIVQSILVACAISPLTAWLLSALAGFSLPFPVPWAGDFVIERYRFIYLLLAAMTVLGALGMRQVRRHWLLLGGPNNYRAPLGAGAAHITAHRRDGSAAGSCLASRPRPPGSGC